MPTPPAVNPEPGVRRLLITAGPTHEPIDAVRYIGNRSSGRLGIALADAAAGQTLTAGTNNSRPVRPWLVTLLLGPTALLPAHTQVRTRRFLTTADLESLLREEAPACDVLVMAAAVADYRPRPAGAEHGGKIRRGSGPLTLELEPTPDLLAAVAKSRRTDQLVVGFALEPRERLLESAQGKLERKGLDVIVANPLETMDAPTIEATVLARTGIVYRTDAPITKESFAETLLRLIEQAAPGAGGQR